MCSCAAGEVSCIGVPLHSMPALPRRALHHVEVMQSELTALEDAALAGTRTASLRLIGDGLVVIAPHALAPLAGELRSLDLSYNQLQEVPAALRPLKSLHWLSLHGNQLTALNVDWGHLRDTLASLYLGAGSLAELRHLHTLELDNNHLSVLTASSVPASLRSLSAQHNALVRVPYSLLEPGGPPRLQHLMLRGNLVRTLPRAGLRAHKALDRLDLADNNIQTLPSRCFNGTLSVRDLRLDSNSLRALPANALEGFGTARLSLASNRLEYLHPAALQGLEHSLEHLDLDGNALRVFPAEALANLTRLRSLLLANNRLSEVGGDAMAGVAGTLRALSLAGNDLHALPLAALRRCVALSHLNLGYNGIPSLHAEDLRGWGASLDTLLLASNKVASLEARAFRHAPRLRELNLSFNRLAGLHADAFLDLAALQSLEASFSLAELDRFPEDALRPLVALRWLALDNNDIRAMDSGALKTLANLEFLNLEDNLLSELPPGLFGPQHARLRELRLGGNSLRAVRTADFRGLRGLRTLVLSGNHIKVVESAALEDLPRLETLLLADNGMTKLQPGALRNLPALATLDLHRNRLQVFSLSAFVNVSRPEAPLAINASWNRVAELYSADTEGAPLYVHTLDLSHNFVAELKTKFLSGVGASLRRLHLAHNRISRLDGHVLAALQSLELLSLQDNDLVTLAPRAFQGCDMLQVLLLQRNHIDALQPEQFARMASLRVLDLSHNRLRGVPVGALEATPLERLDLSHNDLAAVPSGALAEVGGTLRWLGLAGNALQHLDGTVFVATPGLRHLDLAANKLTFLPDNVFSPLGALLSLQLGHNPLRANLAELLHYRLGRESFAEVPRLATLTLRALPLDTMEADTLQPLRLLRVLRAEAWTRLGPHGLGAVLGAAPSLKVLALSVGAKTEASPLPPHVTGTQLAEFPAALFVRLAHIPHLALDFRENGLSSMAPETFYRNSSSWERAGTTLISGGINLKGNPWVCDCSLSWLGAWLRRWLREVLQVGLSLCLCLTHWALWPADAAELSEALLVELRGQRADFQNTYALIESRLDKLEKAITNQPRVSDPAARPSPSDEETQYVLGDAESMEIIVNLGPLRAGRPLNVERRAVTPSSRRLWDQGGVDGDLVFSVPSTMGEIASSVCISITDFDDDQEPEAKPGQPPGKHPAAGPRPVEDVKKSIGEARKTVAGPAPKDSPGKAGKYSSLAHHCTAAERVSDVSPSFRAVPAPTKDVTAKNITAKDVSAKGVTTKDIPTKDAIVKDADAKVATAKDAPAVPAPMPRPASSICFSLEENEAEEAAQEARRAVGPKVSLKLPGQAQGQAYTHGPYALRGPRGSARSSSASRLSWRSPPPGSQEQCEHRGDLHRSITVAC
ncbi:chaoptin-like [Thrips palmi]|uniref:Chaoptin-like n=1 Tax=Thrips palmi TaxID=161013 RepID=A0A6P8YSD8_THRPL|nr:chaoptin-like [Thrips palmi]